MLAFPSHELRHISAARKTILTVFLARGVFFALQLWSHKVLRYLVATLLMRSFC